MKTVVFSILGVNLDRRGKGAKRWDAWRPTLSLCQHEDLLVDRMELVLESRGRSLSTQLIEDIGQVSPETVVNEHLVKFSDPWDFAQVYAALRELIDSYEFDPDNERYLVHMTTGTHVAQICWFLLTEARHIPGELIQSSPPRRGDGPEGQYHIIDLDLSRYDQIASRFAAEHLEGTTHLKQGIATRNAAFNAMIGQLETVSIRSREPILLTGPTGAGKSQLAKQVHELKRQRQQLSGPFVSVNCATLRGDNVMSALFGHVRGAYTGAAGSRAGLLREADGGLLFLDEIGELGLDEQAMLLNAIEHRRFLPLGSDTEVSSDFQLIAGTNRNLTEAVRDGRFREDLLARIDTWTYRLPSLAERIEDLEPNIEFELARVQAEAGIRVRFAREALERYLAFGTREASWRANFRDLNSSIKRMTTLCDGGRITAEVVQAEIALLKRRWGEAEPRSTVLDALLDDASLADIDSFDRVQLEHVVGVCAASPSLAEAGRRLFEASRLRKRSSNDSHRLKQYLARFGLSFSDIHARARG